MPDADEGRQLSSAGFRCRMSAPKGWNMKKKNKPQSLWKAFWRGFAVAMSVREVGKKGGVNEIIGEKIYAGRSGSVPLQNVTYLYKTQKNYIKKMWFLVSSPPPPPTGTALGGLPFITYPPEFDTMPSLRRTLSTPVVRASPYSTSPLAARGNGHRRSSGSETSNRRVLADIEWWRVTEGQCHQSDEDRNRGIQDLVSLDMSWSLGIPVIHVEGGVVSLPRTTADGPDSNEVCIALASFYSRPHWLICFFSDFCVWTSNWAVFNSGNHAATPPRYSRVLVLLFGVDAWNGEYIFNFRHWGCFRRCSFTSATCSKTQSLQYSGHEAFLYVRWLPVSERRPSVPVRWLCHVAAFFCPGLSQLKGLHWNEMYCRLETTREMNILYPASLLDCSNGNAVCKHVPRCHASHRTCIHISSYPTRP